MSAILIFCKDCGKQVPSSEARDQLCLDCRVRRSVADLRDEHARPVVRAHARLDELHPDAGTRVHEEVLVAERDERRGTATLRIRRRRSGPE